jgi:hypothetical protein
VPYGAQAESINDKELPVAHPSLYWQFVISNQYCHKVDHLRHVNQDINAPQYIQFMMIIMNSFYLNQ